MTRDFARRYLGDACCKGDDGLVHYNHTITGVWCTEPVYVEVARLSRRDTVVTCLWCTARRARDD